MQTKLTPELQEKVCQLLRNGTPLDTCAWAAGVDESTFFRWRRRGRVEVEGIYHDFYIATQRSMGECEIICLSVINKAARDGEWQAARWRLEHLRPDLYGPKLNVTHEERKKVADDVVGWLREGLDAETFSRVAQVLLDRISRESDGDPEPAALEAH